MDCFGERKKRSEEGLGDTGGGFPLEKGRGGLVCDRASPMKGEKKANYGVRAGCWLCNGARWTMDGKKQSDSH